MKPITIDRLRINHLNNVLVDVAFEIHTSLALVGQSGSGKSLILKTLLGLTDKALEVTLEKQCGFEWIRGKSVALVPQNPFTALSPLTKIADQMFLERARCEEIFGWLGLGVDLLNRYPSELSGGQLQRVVVAMALSFEPSLLLLDEPTTALDPHAKKVMIELLRTLQAKMGFSLLFVTHDMGVAAELCEDICVLKEGYIVEEGKMAHVLANPKNGYTRQLIDADFKTRDFRV
ncbi:MAG: ATP-binding cassette domain-containing protein [Campylobacterales bacterium]|nr:ATP-binding cassette domain-containing protein [Campylobacterales bacterium]